MKVADYDAAIPKDTVEGLRSGRELKSWVICQGNTFHCGRNVLSKTERGEDAGFRPWDFQMKTGEFTVNSLRRIGTGLVARGHGSPSLE